MIYLGLFGLGLAAKVYSAYTLHKGPQHVPAMLVGLMAGVGLMAAGAAALGVKVYKEQARLQRQVRQLTETIVRVSGGELTARCEIEDDGSVAHAAAAFNRIADTMQHTEDSLSSFVSNVAHELRTPLTSICGFADCMLDNIVPPEEYPRYLQIISQEGKRLSRVVRNMLSATRMEGNRFDLRPHRLDLAVVVRDVLNVNEQRIKEKNICVVCSMQPEVPVYADTDAVQQVVSNIVDNALKFINTGGKLTLQCQQEKGMVKLAITNTGDGIDAEKIRYVFDRFYKADTSRALSTTSCGLGLFICRLLIQASGGDIWAQSEVGKDCTFTFTLPQDKHFNL